MATRRLVTTVAVLAVALFAMPGVAAAKTLQFRGVVAGAPYGASKGDIAVPVLYSKQTTRAARLESAVGLVVVKRGLSVRMPAGTAAIRPLALRMGDQFKGAVRMKKSYSKSFYPSVRFSSVTVQFRAKELSLSEVTAAIDELRRALAALQAQHAPDYQAQIDAINKRLDQLGAGGMPDLSKFALLSDLPDMSQYLKIGDLPAALSGSSVITSLQGQVSTLQTQVATLTTRLGNVCTALKSATIDPDGNGPLGSIGVISLPGLTGPNACP